MSDKKYTFINVQLDGEMVSMLDALVSEDTQITGVKMDRSKTVKRLIRQETERRNKEKLVIVDLPAPDGAQAPVLGGVRNNGK